MPKLTLGERDVEIGVNKHLELISVCHTTTTLPLKLQTNISVQLYFLLRVASVHLEII